MQLGPDAFLLAAFATRQPNEKVALGLANRNNKGFTPKGWEPGIHVPASGQHYNLAAFKAEAPRATIDNVTRVFVIMFDDVGNLEGKSKAPIDRVRTLLEESRPHAIIATRRVGDRFNGQACWFIEPVSHEVARVFTAAAAKVGWCDPDCSGGMRWARPPGSIKQDGNGYAATVEYANLDAPRVEIEALARALGLAESWREEINARSSTGPSNDGAPPADDVRAAMKWIVNDLDRSDWLRVGMALRACCGDPPALSYEEGFALFDEFSQKHPSYIPRDTIRTWNSLRSSRVGFGTLVHFARDAVLEIGSGRFNDDPVSPQTPACVIAPDTALARAAMKALQTTHALVIPDLDPLLVRLAELPQAASRIVVAYRGTPAQEQAARTLYRRALALGIEAKVLRPQTRSTR